MVPQQKINIQDFFKSLNKDTIDLVDDFYDEKVHFKDPMSEFKDRAQLKEYYLKLYKDVEEIRFRFSKEAADGDARFVAWTMVLKSRLNSGKPIVVDGVSHITFGGKEGKAVYHRDYFDMGEFVYENVPVLSGMVRFVKKKISQHD